MKGTRICTVLMLAVLALGLWASVAAAQSVYQPQLVTRPLKWRVGAGATTTVGAGIDSTAKNLGTVTDTLRIDRRDWFFAPNDTSIIARVSVQSPNTTASIDTLSYFIDASPVPLAHQSSAWVQVASKASIVLRGATDKTVTFPIFGRDYASITAALTGVQVAYSPTMWPYYRLRMTIVTGTFKAAVPYLTYWRTPGSQLPGTGLTGGW
jgi:hypothetical protein